MWIALRSARAGGDLREGRGRELAPPAFGQFQERVALRAADQGVRGVERGGEAVVAGQLLVDAEIGLGALLQRLLFDMPLLFGLSVVMLFAAIFLTVAIRMIRLVARAA